MTWKFASVAFCFAGRVLPESRRGFMNEHNNIETIQQVYSAFGRGDVNFIVSQLTDDVAWKGHFAEQVPWAGDYSGKANVPKFFDAIFSNVDVLGFEPSEFVAQGQTVVSMGTFEAISKTTGKSGVTPWIFVWKFRDGKIESYEQYHSAEFANIFLA